MKKAAAPREAKNWLKNLIAAEVLKLSAEVRSGVARGKDESLPPVVQAKALTAKGDLTVKPDAVPRFWAAFILISDPD
jgi:CHAT domain-containing protein